MYDDGTAALRGVTLSFGRGQIFALLGHNGAGAVVLCCVGAASTFLALWHHLSSDNIAGKSTLNNIITGTDTPTKVLLAHCA